MPLESCMLILDNSEYMRNGDYPPTRFQAQAEAVQTVFTAKTDANPESAVGMMTMAGNSPSLLVTPTNDLGRLMHALSKVLISNTAQLSTAISIAQLALKHRENKNQRQRIVIFVGSPLGESAESLVKLGKRLRKNNVFVDIVTFGDEGRDNDEKLRGLVEAVGDESNLVSVPPGERFLSDVIASSPILFDGENPMAAAGGFEGDIDPNMDPELAMAIRMSLQEAQAQQSQSADAGPSSGAGVALPDSLTQPLSTTHPSSSSGDVLMAPGDKGNLPGTPNAQTHAEAADKAGAIAESGTGSTFTSGNPLTGNRAPDVAQQEEEDEELKRALAMSRGEGGDIEMEEEEDEEAAIARAIAMSLEGQEEGKDKNH
ncbi:hypothetical protein AYX15_00686 [Cryptococcus neoformans]|nr:hypothetical protein AYX15_00686 [Cryptococcus neoformans var. grubii]